MGFVDSVKDIAGKFGESFERGAKSVSNSSKKFAEKTRLKREISHIESDIDTDYIELGKAMYEKVCDDTDSEFAVTIADIKEKNGKLEELRALLMNLEDRITCSSCGANIRKEQAYCDKCGAKVIIIAPEPPEGEEEKEEVTAEVVYSSDETE